MSESSRALFLSYASQDTPSAQRICEALRTAGVEVWFDQSELRGGDAWDQRIRHQIRDCTLFVPIISAHTQARAEGYFRLEWRLADQRTHLMGRRRAFIVPVCIDDTPESDADAPDSFSAAQWTRLPDGATPAAFVQRVKQLLMLEVPLATPGLRLPTDILPASDATRARREAAPHGNILRIAPKSRAILAGLVAALLAMIVYGVVTRYRSWSPLVSEQRQSNKSSAAPSAEVSSESARIPTTAPIVPERSVAVLPFVDMSEKKDQEYFSDGLSEELIDQLARGADLKVIARTSSFQFKGKNDDVRLIGQRLGVANLLEGSVRKAGNTVRISAQLIRVLDGSHVWSQSYDREMRGIFELQREIATAVAAALRVTLLGERDVGGTRNSRAFDSYLRARAAKIYESQAANHEARKAYDEAIRLDPDYALAHAGRASTLAIDAGTWATDPKDAARLGAQARASAEKAVALAPQSAGALAALALVLGSSTLEIAATDNALRRALMLEPNNAEVLVKEGLFAVSLGHADALTNAKRLIELNPLDSTAHVNLGIALYQLHRYAEALASMKRAVALSDDLINRFWLACVQLMMGQYSSAASTCEAYSESLGYCQQVLAIAYRRLGRNKEALQMLERQKASLGDTIPYYEATIYAQWGDIDRALELLELALRQQDPSLLTVRVDPLLEPLRREARFRAIVDSLPFPKDSAQPSL